MPRAIQNAFATALIAVAPLLLCSVARAGDFHRDDFTEPYWQRIDGITAGVGDAKEVNAITHMVDPWPRYIRDRRIPANGERMSGAVERYRRGRLHLTPPPIAPIYTTTGEGLRAAGTGGAAAGVSDGTPASAPTATGR
jgi:hypothetical protein